MDLNVIEQQLCVTGDALMRAYRLLRARCPASPEDMTALEGGMDSLLAVERAVGIITPVELETRR